MLGQKGWTNESYTDRRNRRRASMSDKEGETRMSVGCVYHWTTCALQKVLWPKPLVAIARP